MKVAEKVAVLQALLERVQRNAAARGAPGHASAEGATPRAVAAAPPPAAPERIEPIGRSRADSLPEAGWDAWADVAEEVGTDPPPPAVAAAHEVAAAIPVAPLVAPPPPEAPPASPLLETTELELAPGPAITFPESPASRRAAELQLGPLPTPPPDSPTPVPRPFQEPPPKARVPTPPRAQPVVVLSKRPAAAAVRKSPPQFWSEAGDRVSEPPADFEQAIAHALETGQGKRVESVLPPPPSSEPPPEPASAPIASPSAPPAPTIMAKPEPVPVPDPDPDPEPDSDEDDDTTDQAPGAGPLSRRRARPRLRPARRPRSRAAGGVARVAKIALGGLVIASLVGGAFLLWSNRSRSETQNGETPSASSGPLSHEAPRPAPSAPSSAPNAQPPASAEVARPPALTTVADGVNDRGALIVESPVPASVYVNGVLAGAANERLQVACGLRHVRLARPELPPPGQSFPMWTTDGISVLIACGGVTKAAIAPGGSAP